jgi:hypothetical protein
MYTNYQRKSNRYMYTDGILRLNLGLTGTGKWVNGGVKIGRTGTCIRRGGGGICYFSAIIFKVDLRSDVLNIES